ncbi:hypothetical protein BGW80DRAFT_1252502 [Lactifluus volemus]|nr:hypothetical protein BGW80DRAFT_1252502 [Lactifluus volemus]
MMSALTWAVTTAFVGFALWRNGRSSRNMLIPTPDLPHGYYSEGTHNAHCMIVRDTLFNDMSHCEDAVFWERVEGSTGAVIDKVLLLSCDPNRKAWNTVMGPLKDPDPRGALWLYHPNTRRPPRRIGLEGRTTHSNLFVVNHARNGSTIEQFSISWNAPDHARWVRTISGPELVAPNSLALTGPTSFYLTNDHLFTRRMPGVLGKTLPITESVLALPLGWATHVTVSATTTTSSSSQETHTYTTVASWHTSAIASTTLGEIRFYTRDPATDTQTRTQGTPSLSLRARVPTPFAPDNIMFDSQGVLIAAGHPHFQSLVAVARTKQRRAHLVGSCPSRPRPQTQSGDGSAFSSSSAALRDAETGVLYIVGLYEEGLMAKAVAIVSGKVCHQLLPISQDAILNTESRKKRAVNRGKYMMTDNTIHGVAVRQTTKQNDNAFINRGKSNEAHGAG